MKKILIATSLSAIILSACEKGSGYSENAKPITEGGKVKFINASYNAPALIFYGKDTTIKFSGTTPSAAVITGIAVGSTYPINGYAVINPYNDSLKIKVPKNSTTSPGLFKDIAKINISNDSTYSVFVVDEFPNLSTLVLKDTLRNFNAIPNSTYDARFVNAIYGAPAVDIFSTNLNTVIFSNIPYKGYTSFSNFIVGSADEIQVRLAGTSTVVAKLAFTPVSKRTYTWFARGKNGVTTGTTAPALTFYTNQ